MGALESIVCSVGCLRVDGGASLSFGVVSSVLAWMGDTIIAGTIKPIERTIDNPLHIDQEDEEELQDKTGHPEYSG